jgi:hypothetical protein
MRVFRPLLASLAAFGVLGLPANDAPKGDFIKFSDFLAQVNKATYSEWAHTAVSGESAFDEMKKHILTMYSGVTNADKVTSFFLDGSYVDCIPFMEQPSIHLPPSIGDNVPKPHTTNEIKGQGDGDKKRSKLAPSIMSPGGNDPFENPISCPDGTIPMVRLTLESMTKFKTLRDFFRKEPPSHPGQA